MCRAFSPWKYCGALNLGLADQAGMCQAFGLGKFSCYPSLIAPLLALEHCRELFNSENK